MKLLPLLPIVLLLLTTASCTKVIDIDVKESDTRYVIEGVLTEEAGSCRVTVSRTRLFNEPNDFPPVTGALVTITDNGQLTTLVETAPGVYRSSLTGVPGHTYNLSVRVGSDVFTATNTMPVPVHMDTLYIAPGPFGQFRFATIAYRDPAGVPNYYRFVQYLNGTKDPELFWEADEFTDGERVVLQLDTGIDEQDDPRAIQSGDTVTIELQALDPAIYRFWASLDSDGADGSVNTAAPSNPLSNIRGGALGYFSTHTIHRRTVITP
jgi:hypothetical protein